MSKRELFLSCEFSVCDPDLQRTTVAQGFAIQRMNLEIILIGI